MAAITKPPYNDCIPCMACGGYACSTYSTWKRQAIRVDNEHVISYDDLVEEDVESEGAVLLDEDALESEMLIEEEEEPPPVRTARTDSHLDTDSSRVKYVENKYGISVGKIPLTNPKHTLQVYSLLEGYCPDCGEDVYTYSFPDTAKKYVHMFFFCSDRKYCRMSTKMVRNI